MSHTSRRWSSSCLTNRGRGATQGINQRYRLPSRYPYIIGLAHTTVFDSALLASTIPVWTALLLFALRQDRVAPLQWLGILVSLAGVAWFLTAAPSHQTELRADRSLGPADLLLGNALTLASAALTLASAALTLASAALTLASAALTLASAALFALYGVVNRRPGARYSPPELMNYTLVVGTLALAPFGVPALLRQDWSRVTWQVWLIIPYSVLFPIYITYSIWKWALARRGAGYVSLYSYAVPILSGVVGLLVVHEGLAAGQVVGAAVVLGGMLVARWGIGRGQRRSRGREAPMGDGADARVAAPAAAPID